MKEMKEEELGSESKGRGGEVVLYKKRRYGKG